jgi:predicted DNA-binding protein (MmcQ/YjbR family)
MNVDSVRGYCLSFSQAREKLQWGETLCFKVDGKIFAMLSLDSVPPSLCFKCTPEKFVELCEQEGIRPAPYVGRYKWVLLERLDVVRDEELEELIRQSYEMVTAKSKGKGKTKSKGKGKTKSKGKKVKGKKVKGKKVKGLDHRGHEGSRRKSRARTSRAPKAKN